MAEMEYPPQSAAMPLCLFSKKSPGKGGETRGRHSKREGLVRILTATIGQKQIELTARRAPGCFILEKRNHLCRVISTRTMARRRANLLFPRNEAIPR